MISFERLWACVRSRNVKRIVSAQDLASNGCVPYRVMFNSCELRSSERAGSSLRSDTQTRFDGLTEDGQTLVRLHQNNMAGARSINSATSDTKFVRFYCSFPIKDPELDGPETSEKD